MEKGPLDNMVTKDKGKAAITAIKYSAPTEQYFSAFTTTPNHFGYGMMGHVSVLGS